MEFFKKTPNIDFIGKRVPAIALSLLMVIAAIGTIAVKGFNFSIDFTGGVVLEVGYPGSAELDPIRERLEEAGHPDALVQHFGDTSEVLIRLQPEADKSNAEISEEVLRALRADEPRVQMRRVEFVGPQVGEQLTQDGILAAMFALIGILIYVGVRFQWKLAVGAVAGLAHDSLIALGVISWFQMPFDLTVLAAILTLIGYSLNDTVVVYDRLRENFRISRESDIRKITNDAINQTLARTVMTGITTLLVLFALFYWGGEDFYSFTISLIIGIVVGTYSTIFVATIVSLMLGLKREDLLPLKESAPVDDMP
ncbi:MAG TPA: protein translocase subunit SecF [Gammaproteobacteria bacterium]|nr:protein translocase subunit SecF [Gammaproteobacteria bacterium]